MARHGAILLLSGMQAAQGVLPGGAVGEFEPTERPGPDFPGPTALASNLSWPSGHQPTRFAAWPQVGYGTHNRTLLPCWQRRVLHDIASGWPGVCLNLFHAKRFSSPLECRNLCWNEPRCPVWQFVNQTLPGQCWVGFGTDCAWRNGKADAINVHSGQRIMHGSVRVLKNLSGWKINNLYQIGMYHAGNEHLSILRCKAWCYSSIACQYWQYGPGGCWVDAPFWSTAHGSNPTNKVQYPLTTNGGASNSSPEALTMMWGEYIQHYCPPQPQHTTHAPVSAALQVAPQMPSVTMTTSPPSSSVWSSWWVWCLIALAILCIGGVAYGVTVKPGQSNNLKTKRGGRRATSDYSEEDRPLMVSPQKRRPAAVPELEAPTADYLLEDGAQDDRSGGPPPRGEWMGGPRHPHAMDHTCAGCSGQEGLPDTQVFADPAAPGYPQLNFMNGQPDSQGMPLSPAVDRMAQMATQTAMPPPTQLMEMMHAQAPGAMPTQAAMRGQPQLMQQGLPFPQPGGQMPSMQTMQGFRGPTPRLM